ncbi:hypothetical protein [Mycoplasma zalophidermidis]|uniref:hypothetical protein n=1 Tax=Mycoplasma zalophidermidis TaxID=398174 RepID=UPI00215D336F|nr:hypothetical protein [Mycoplasma zalophidermidis]MCR8966403.1 hypothetical protein [Mycoplasma zalophidermidis]
MKKRLLLISPILIASIAGVAMNINDSIDKNLHKNSNLTYVADRGVVNDINNVQASDWMSQIPDNKSFFSLSIPGTHDSSMYNGYGISYAFGWQYALTQYYNFHDQLKIGIRAFDLRMQNDGKLVHGPVNSNQVFRDAIRDFASFLDKHPTEFIVARVKDEYFNVDKQWQAQGANKIYNDVLDEFKKYLYNPDGKSFWELSKEGFNVDKFRGKIVILNHWHHKVNTNPRGGFMYKFIASEQTIQDNYNGINSIDEKVKYITQAMENANKRSNLDATLHVNFMSMASGWRPFSSSQQVNPAVNKWLNKHNDLGTLGIVYMDYPGPALIQSVYRTNFNYKDDYINNGGLGPLMNKISAKSVFEGDNKIIIDTSDNPSCYKNAIFEIIVDEHTIKKITVPKEFNSNELIIDLGSNFHFNLANKLKIVTYKLTPNDGWYNPKKYNENELSIKILRDDLLHEKLDLVAEIKSIQRYYEQEYPQIYNYIDEKFIKKIQSLKRTQTNARLEFDDINSKWHSISKLMEILIDDLANFSDSQIELKIDNLSSIFNEQNASKIRNFTNEIRTKLKNIFDTENDKVITSSQLVDFSNKLKKYRWISKYLPAIINDFESLNLLKIKSDFENNYQDYNFAKSYWIEKLTNGIEKPNKIFNELISNDNSNNTMILARNLSNQMYNYLSSLISQVKKINKTLSVYNQYFKGENEVLLPHFMNEIKEKIIDDSFNPDLIINQSESFKIQLNLLKKLIRDSDNFKKKNYFNLNSPDKRSYSKLIEETNNVINDNNLKVLNSQFIKEKISALNEIELSISNSTKIYNKVLNTFNDSQSIIAGHRKILKEKLDSLEIYTDLSTKEINKEINSLILVDYAKKIKSLKNLNLHQSRELLRQISDTLNEKEIKSIFLNFQTLDYKMNELTIQKDKFNNLDTIKGFGYLDSTEQKELKNLLSTINSEMTHFIESDKIDDYIKKLSKYNNIFNIDTMFMDFNNLITKSSKLYEFEKQIFKKNLSLVRKFKEFKELKTNFDLEADVNRPLSDEKTFKSFSKTQFKKVINELKGSLSKESYTQIKNNYLGLLDSINIAKRLIKQHENIYSQSEYISNYEKSKTEFKEKFDSLNNSIINSTDPELLNDEITKFRLSIIDLIESSKKFKNEKQKEKVFNNYLLTLDEFSSLTKHENPGNILNQTFKEIIEKVRNNKIELSASLQDIVQATSELNKLINQYILIIDELVNTYKEKNKVFNNFVQEFSFGIPENKHNQLPSKIRSDDLIKLNNNESFIVTNLSLTPDDVNGTLSIDYIIKSNDFTVSKSQLINDFININKFNYLKEVSTKKQALNDEIAKANELIKSMDKPIYSAIINELNLAIKKYSNVDINNLLWYDNAIDSINKTIEKSISNKIDIETKVRNKNLNDAAELINKINGYLNLVNRYAFDEFVANVSLFIKEMKTYKLILSNINLDSTPIDEIKKRSLNSFQDISKAGDMFISNKFSDLLSRVKFEVPSELLLKDINIGDINIINGKELNISIKSINKNIENKSINIFYDASYKNLTEQKNYLISNIRVNNNANKIIDVIDENNSNDKTNSIVQTKHENDVNKNKIEAKIPLKAYSAIKTKKIIDNSIRNSTNNNLKEIKQIPAKQIKNSNKQISHSEYRINNDDKLNKKIKNNFNKNYLYLIFIPVLGVLIIITILITKKCKKKNK